MAKSGPIDCLIDCPTSGVVSEAKNGGSSQTAHALYFQYRIYVAPIYFSEFDQNIAKPSVLLVDYTPGAFYRQYVILYVH